MTGKTPTDPITLLQAETPLRVWSLIVTIFGDVVMREGRVAAPEPLWIGPILALLDLMGVDAAQARTNLSRLVAGGTLIRTKAGRNTFYRIAPEEAAAFARAADRIYGRVRRSPTGRFHLALIDRCDNRSAARDGLVAAGFRFISPTTGILPEHHGVLAPPMPEGAIPAEAMCSPALAAAASDAWNLPQLQENYQRFCATFAEAATAIPADAAQAAALRLVLVHLYRRLILRDPGLPEVLLPGDWAGGRAREIFAAALARLGPQAQSWLEDAGFGAGATLTPPAP